MSTGTESYVQVAPDSTGKLVDTFAVADQVTGATKQRQAVVIGDPSSASSVWGFGADVMANALPITFAIDQDPAPVLRLVAALRGQSVGRAAAVAGGAGFVPSEIPSFLAGL